MSFWIISMAVIAGVALAAAASHALIGISRRPWDPAFLALGATALSVSLGAIAVSGLHASPSEQAHVFVSKWLFFPTTVTWTIAGIWYVYFSTRVSDRRLLFGLTVVFGVVLALNATAPLGLLHAELGQMQTVRVFGTEVLVEVDAPPHPLLRVHDAATLAAVLYIAYALLQVLRRGERSSAANVTVILPLLALSMLLDLLGDYANVFGHYMSEVSFFAVALTATVMLQKESRKAERDLREYRDHLEAMVEARVADLDQANAELVREAADRHRAEEAMRQRVAELDALQRIGQVLAEVEPLDRRLHAALVHVLALLAGRQAQIDLLRECEDGGRILERGGAAMSVQQWFPSRLPLPELDHFWRVAETGRSQVVARLDELMLPAELRVLLQAHHLREMLLTPLLDRGEVVGVLGVGRGRGGPLFTQRDEMLAATVADRLAVAVKNERLRARERMRAAAEERDRLARDLHDAVTQSVYSASLIAEALPTIWQDDPEDAMHNLERLRSLVRAALSEMRTLLFELRPAALEAADLSALLARLGDALAGQLQIPVQVRVQEGLDLPVDVKIALYRVAQEALANVGKHARAGRATVAVNADESRVVLAVEDDGRGFDSKMAGPEHMGLRIMQERARAVGASVEVTTAPGEGTAVVAVWPLPAQRAKEVLELAAAAREEQ